MDKFFALSEIQIDKMLDKAELEYSVGFDTETSKLDPTSIMAGFSLYLPNAGVSYYVPLEHTSHKRTLTKTQVERLCALNVVTYNGGYDLMVFEHNYGTHPNPVGDGDILAKMFQLHLFGLKKSSEQYGLTDTPIYIEDVLGKDNFDFTQAKLDQKTLDYACQDAILAYKLEAELSKRHHNVNQYPALAKVYALELKVMPVLARASVQGLPIDSAELESVISQMKVELNFLQEKICRIINRPSEFKLNSTARLAAALYNPPEGKPDPTAKTEAQKDMTLPGLGIPFEGKYSTAIDVLEQIEAEHPVITDILRWKSLHAVITRDMPQVREFAKTGKLHSEFLQLGEDGTSRIYSKAPNVISMSSEARRCMHPPKGKVYVHFDFDSAELRIVALLAGDLDLLRTLDSGADPHKRTYSKMMGVPEESITKDQRELGKALNYAPIYGQEARGLSHKIGVTVPEAQDLLDKYWQAKPEIKSWVEHRKKYCESHGRTYTVLGRVRKIPEVFTKKRSLKETAKRKAVNTAGQGSCGDALKLALVNLDSHFRSESSQLSKYNPRIVCPVFDAVLIELDEKCLDDKENVESILRSLIEVKLTNQSGISTKMKASCGWSINSWAEACRKDKSRLNVDFQESLMRMETETGDLLKMVERNKNITEAEQIRKEMSSYVSGDLFRTAAYDSEKLTYEGKLIRLLK